MSELLATLPKKDDIKSVLPKDFSAGSLDGMGNQVTGLTYDLTNKIPSQSQGPDLKVALPADLSADGVKSRLQEPLRSMSAINADSLSASVTNSALPVSAPVPAFDINTPMTQIGSALNPSLELSGPEIDENNMPGFNSDEALWQLKKLAAAGKATPMKVVTMFLKVFDSFIATAADKEKLLELAAQSLEEIYIGQVQKVKYNIPNSALEDLKLVVQSDFLTRYEKLLDDIENSETVNFQLLNQARQQIIPQLVKVKHARETLVNFSEGKIEVLQVAIDQILEITGDGKSVLQDFFDNFESKIITVLKTIKPPVEAIKGAAQKIVEFLTATAQKADEAATKVSDLLSEKLDGIDKFLSSDLTGKIEELDKKINSFLTIVNTETDKAVSAAKSGLVSVTDAVQEFFEKVNELKKKLEDAVKELAGKVSVEIENAFRLVQEKIEQLLNKIDETLHSGSVQDALKSTKEGIDKFKKVMEDVSLQPLFDLVVTKTGDLEVKIESIKTSELGVPQKTALKLGAKIIKEVKVDEIIKPELIAIFKDLRDPIAALIEELKKGVLQINQLIDDFAPGTILKDLIEKSGPFKAFIDFLESAKPSVLLKPLKDAHSKLVGLIETLNPDILINKLQSLFNELYVLTEVISPAKLNAMINSAVSDITGELQSIKDVKLDQILQKVKETISLKKLLEGTGIEDIADAEMWTLMKYYLGGQFLDKITDALKYVEDGIGAKVKLQGFDQYMQEVAKMNEQVNLQLGLTKDTILAKIQDLKQSLSTVTPRLNELDQRRMQILINRSDIPEYKFILEKMSLEFFIPLESTVNTILAAGEAKVTQSLQAFSTLLQANKTKLANLNKSTLELAAPTIFKQQFSNPINKIVTSVKAELAVFTEAVDAINQIVVTLTKLPGEIDKKVAAVLDTAVGKIKNILASSIKAINAAANLLTSKITDIYNTLIKTLDKFSPIGLLNSFSIADFEQGGLDGIKSQLISPTDEIAVFMSTRLTSEQITLLKNNNETANKIVLQALNDSVFAPKLNEKKEVAKAALVQRIAAAKDNESISENMKIRYNALLRQLEKATTPKTSQEKIRLNRCILEAMYPELFKMSLQSLHPFIVQQIDQIYPETLIAQLDVVYLGVVEKIKQIPKEYIQKNLDALYRKVKDEFMKTFDLEGIFRVLQVKLDGMDEDLATGLDRISYEYNQLINKIDSKLAE
jgi:hypothetical protein